MAAIVFQSKFPRDLLAGKHDFDAHTFRVGLSNTAIATSVEDTTGVTPIATGNGWTGPFTTAATPTDGAGTASVAFADSATITAAGGSIPAFRYAYLYNDTVAPKALIGVADFGASTTITDGNSFVIDFSGNAITITNV